MADITDQHDQGSPSALDEHAVGNGNAVEPRGIKRSRQAAADDDDDDDDKPGRERRKIEIKFITDKSRRHITFSKRKAGIMKKVSCNGIYALLLNFTNAFWEQQLTLHPGIRIVCPHRYSSPPPRCFRNWSRLYLHYSQTSTVGYQGGG